MTQEATRSLAAPDKVKAFIEDSFLYGEPLTLGEDESFLEAGILDSTGVLQLVSFLEREFGIKIENDELVPDNLDSLGGIDRYLVRKQTV